MMLFLQFLGRKVGEIGRIGWMDGFIQEEGVGVRTEACRNCYQRIYVALALISFSVCQNFCFCAKTELKLIVMDIV